MDYTAFAFCTALSALGSKLIFSRDFVFYEWLTNTFHRSKSPHPLNEVYIVFRNDLLYRV